TLFGEMNWTDAFTSLLFISLDIGLNAYIRKEISVRQEHASDFYGGAVVVRVAMTAVLFLAMALYLAVDHRPPEVCTLVYLYGLTQFFVQANSSLGALLHAKGEVAGMSALSVVTKVVWGAGCFAAIRLHTGLWLYGASFLASESVETVALSWLARKHLGLMFRVDLKETKRVLRESIPYFVTV